MALNIILAALVAVSALNFILIWDLCNRNKRLVQLYDEVHRVTSKLAFVIMERHP